MKNKPTIYSLTVPKPCHENWNEMTPNEKGRFCNQCSKTVIDFSKMSDRAIVQLIETSTSKICGHFCSNQLSRPLENYQIRRILSFYPLPQLLSGLLLLGTPSCNFSQTDKTKTTELSYEKIGKVKIGEKNVTDSTKNNIISGQLIDSITSEPVFDVLINLIDSGVSTLSFLSDKNGKFTIHLPQTSSNTVQLIISKSGYPYESKSVVINKGKDLPWNQVIQINQAISFLEGEVTIIENPQKKKRIRK